MIDVDGRAYTHEDVLGTLRAIGPWWRQMADARPFAPIAEAAAEQVDALQYVLGETAPAGQDLLADIDRKSARLSGSLACGQANRVLTRPGYCYSHVT